MNLWRHNTKKKSNDWRGCILWKQWLVQDFKIPPHPPRPKGRRGGRHVPMRGVGSVGSVGSPTELHPDWQSMMGEGAGAGMVPGACHYVEVYSIRYWNYKDIDLRILLLPLCNATLWNTQFCKESQPVWKQNFSICNFQKICFLSNKMDIYSIFKTHHNQAKSFFTNPQVVCNRPISHDKA